MDALERNEYWSNLKKLELNIKHREFPPVRPSIVEAPKLGLKVLTPHLTYVFVGRDNNFSGIIVIGCIFLVEIVIILFS